MTESTDTIVALASGNPPAGVAVIRLSGPKVRFALETVCGKLPPARRASLRTIHDRDGRTIDSGLVLFFPGPNSFTGEDCAEFQLHGSRAVVGATISALTVIEGVRLAGPGEFTKRAFENGRMDLTEVEGLGDLIAAQTEMQRRFALELASGGLSRQYAGWAERLLHARAMIEAELDFADEDDVPGSVASTIWEDMASLKAEMEDHLAAGAIAERVRDGFRIAVTGPPNAGKSSLINALARRDVAIVSDIAGTTRDVISVDLDIGGYPATIYDTAGIREAEDAIEREGVRRARSVAETADIVLALKDASAESPGEQAAFPSAISVGTKSDLIGSNSSGYDLLISVRTGKGLDALENLLRAELEKLVDPAGAALPTRRRHRALLEECLVFLENAVIQTENPIELRAEDLRLAASALDRITGRTDTEMLLDVVFSAFCIGK